MKRTFLLALVVVPLFAPPALADRAHSAECSDAYTRAQTLRRDRKLIDARDALRICAQPTCKDFIVKDCSTWLDQVQSSLPTVVPVATDADGNNLPGVRVSMDGHVLLDAIDGRSIEVDPGTHTFSFQALDGTRADKEIVVAEGEQSKHVAVVLGKPRSAQGPTPQPSTAPSAGPVTPPPPVTPERHASALKPVGIAATAVGGVGLTVGAIFGLEAMGKKSDAGCSGTVCPDAQSGSKLHTAQNDATLSTAFFIAGGVLAAGGITIWALAPGSVQVAPSVGSNAAGVAVRGSWR
jgi:hypothetical protein